MPASFALHRLTSDDLVLARRLTTLFGTAFSESEAYAARRPDDTHLARLLGKSHIVVLVALADADVVGGLVAYELDKLERPQPEIYLYDLAVDASRRRRGIAKALIAELRRIAACRGAHLIYVQADYGDDAAVALYTGLGAREDVMHFDIPVDGGGAVRDIERGR